MVIRTSIFHPNVALRQILKREYEVMVLQRCLAMVVSGVLASYPPLWLHSMEYMDMLSQYQVYKIST